MLFQTLEVQTKANQAKHVADRVDADGQRNIAQALDQLGQTRKIVNQLAPAATKMIRIEKEIMGGLKGRLHDIEDVLKRTPSKTDLSLVKQKVNVLTGRVSQYENKVDHVVTPSILALGAQHTQIMSSVGMVRTEISGYLQSAGAALVGNILLAGADVAALSAAALNAAVAGSVTVDLVFRLQHNVGTDAVPSYQQHTVWPTGLVPKIVSSKDTVADADIDAPLYYLKTVTPAAIAGTVTWDTSTTVLMTDTTDVVAGKAIRQDADGQWFEAVSVVEDTSCLIANPHGLSIPTGAAASSLSDIPSFGYDGIMILTVVIDTDEGSTKTYVDGENMKLTVDLVALTKPLDFSAVVAGIANIPIVA